LSSVFEKLKIKNLFIGYYSAGQGIVPEKSPLTADNKF